MPSTPMIECDKANEFAQTHNLGIEFRQFEDRAKARILKHFLVFQEELDQHGLKWEDNDVAVATNEAIETKMRAMLAEHGVELLVKYKRVELYHVLSRLQLTRRTGDQVACMLLEMVADTQGRWRMRVRISKKRVFLE